MSFALLSVPSFNISIFFILFTSKQHLKHSSLLFDSFDSLIIRLLIGIYFNGLLHFQFNKLPIVFSHLNNNKAIKSHLLCVCLCAHFFHSFFAFYCLVYYYSISFHVVLSRTTVSISHHLAIPIGIFLSVYTFVDIRLFINSMHS